jgi:hypothetical protein
MYEKMDALILSPDDTPREQIAYRLNKWDGEHSEHQACLENNCNTFKDGSLNFSPEVDIWIKRRDIYKQLVTINDRRRRGIQVDTGNFMRACENNQIKEPFSLTSDEITTCIAACERRLVELKPVAPLLRTEQIRNCLGEARRNGDKCRERCIRQIMANELSHKHWGGVRQSTKVQSRGALTAVKIRQGDEDLLFNTQAGVEQQGARKLMDRFKLGRTAPISAGQLFDDIGYLGDTTSIQAILEGTYEFPPEMDPHTRLLCEEAHRIFTLKTTDEISNFATEDYQSFGPTPMNSYNPAIPIFTSVTTRQLLATGISPLCRRRNCHWRPKLVFLLIGGVRLSLYCWRRNLATSTLTRCGLSA